MNITGAALVLAGVLTLPAAVYLLWWGTRSPAVVRQTPRQPLLAAVTCLITGSWVTAAAAQMQEQAAFAPNVAIGCPPQPPPWAFSLATPVNPKTRSAPGRPDDVYHPPRLATSWSSRQRSQPAMTLSAPPDARRSHSRGWKRIPACSRAQLAKIVKDEQ